MAENDTSTISPEAHPARQPYAHNRKARLIANSIWNGLLILMIAALLIANAAAMGGEITSRYVAYVFGSILPLALLAPPLSLLMSSGQLDLSQAALVSLIGVILASAAQAGRPLFVFVILCLGIGLLVGVIHALLVGAARISGVLVTLASAALLEGIAIMLGGYDGRWFAPAESFVLVVNALCWLAALALTAGVIVLVILTPFGRRPQPGDPPEPVAKRLLYVGLPYVVSGVMAALAGVVVLTQNRYVALGMSNFTQLRALMAAVVGGTPMGMGVTNGFGGLLGAVIVALLVQLWSVIVWGTDVSPLLAHGLVFAIGLLAVHGYHTAARWLYNRRSSASQPEANPTSAEP